MQKIRQILRAVSEKTVLPTNQISKRLDFGLMCRPSRDYLQINNFFQTSGSVTFLPFAKKGPACVHPSVKFTIQNIVLRVSRRKNSEIFPAGPFFLELLTI